MRVSSNKKAPIHLEIGILLDENTVLTEHGECSYDRILSDTKIYASKKIIDEIWQKKKIGEVLKYDGEISKWRKRTPDGWKHTTWKNHKSEVSVSSSRSFPEEPNVALEAYSDWRDWIESYGGSIAGTYSSASWSLFKTTIRDGVWETPFNGVPGIGHPLGGRLLPCKKERAAFEGDIIQWDLYAAYSRRLGSLQFGGVGSRWIEVNKWINFDRMVERGICVYIEAEITLNESRTLGPLPIRRKEYHPRPISNLSFPISGTIHGIWTYEECRAAIESGAIIKFKRGYYHHATGRKYHHDDWYRIIQEGRENLNGYARTLAKQTGNSLWGRYAMRIRPSKTVWREGNKRVWVKHPVRTLKRNQCMELADQLCGKIRSDLYRFAISANDCLIQGNTDGAWIEYERGWLPPNDDWRIKHRTNRIEILDDATYRYWADGEKDPTYVVPGISSEWTEKVFDRRWNEYAAA